MEYFLGEDRLTKIFYKKWDQVEHPIALVQIVHGMSEHILRYEEFARFLNSKNFIVYGMDLRGHGKTGENVSSLGHFEKDAWKKIMQDIDILRKSQEGLYQLPSFVLGHSMGSLLTRTYLNQYHPDIAGAVIVGTASANRTFLFKSTKFLAGLYKQEDYAHLIHKLAFNGFEKEEPFDWICSDKAQVEKYKNDPYCGFWMTGGFYYEFMKGLLQLSTLERNISLKKEFPILFVSGKEDPVGNMGSYVTDVANNYRKHAMSDIDCVLYENMRHEILNEIDKYKVYDDIAHFLLSHLNIKTANSSQTKKNKNGKKNKRKQQKNRKT